MFKVIEILIDGRELIRGRANTESEAKQICSAVLASNRIENFSIVTIRKEELA